MTIYLTTKRISGRYVSRGHTKAGRLVAQAIDGNASEAEKRVRRQVREWAIDHGWGTITFSHRHTAREVNCK